MLRILRWFTRERLGFLMAAISYLCMPASALVGFGAFLLLFYLALSRGWAMSPVYFFNYNLFWLLLLFSFGALELVTWGTFLAIASVVLGHVNLRKNRAKNVRIGLIASYFAVVLWIPQIVVMFLFLIQLSIGMFVNS